ncbi:MAG: type II secretion system protein [Patescibacteria group bacterium]
METKLKNRKNSTGFTLVELLVVIAIISILTGVIVVAINPVSLLQKSRDARRLSDLDSLFQGISLALAEGEATLVATTTCTTCDSGSGTQVLDGTGYVLYQIPTGMTGISNYLPKLPLDPENTGTNVYTYASDGTDFELNAVLEHPDNAALMSTDGGNASGVYEIGTSLTIL